MAQNNHEIREAIKDAGILSWQVADKLGIHETTFYRRLRKELSQQEKEKLYQIIDELKEAKAVGA